MQIDTIDQRGLDFKDGLKDVWLQQLKRVVLLSGPNGSGKTRLLKRIKALDGFRLGEDHAELRKMYMNSDGSLNLNTRFGNSSAHCVGVEVRVRGKPKVVPFVAKELTLTDPSTLTEDKLLGNADAATKPGAEHLSKSSLPYIQRLQRQAWNARHQDNLDPDEQKNEKLERYESLRKLVTIVLGEELKQDYDNRPTLFGKTIATAGLSDGQSALLQWCVALHAQGTTIGDLILTMDEPENHLHPEAMIATVRRIIEANTEGQIWIATHSVPLIAALFRAVPDIRSVFYLRDGVARYAGEQPEKVLLSLMGGDENVAALRESIDLPEVFASNRFASQCLLQPEVIAKGNGRDPQAATITLGEGNVGNLLDYGAGAGRLLQCLHTDLGDETQSRLNYVTWDVSKTSRKSCVEAIERVYSGGGRWFND